AMRFGWEQFKAHALFLWAVLGSLILAAVAFDSLGKATEDVVALSLIINLASLFVTVTMEIGLLRLSLDLAQSGVEGKLSTLFSKYHLFFRYLGATILYSLMVVVGLVLFIVPGIYFAVKYQFFSYLIVDKDLGLLDALKKSGELTEGVRWHLFVFLLAIIGINILGVLALGIGLLVTLPLSAMAYVYAYRELSVRLALSTTVVSPTPQPSSDGGAVAA
ncbi:MAG: DUF975 family protein, partial [Candidatus Moranbacteria bacterium]|nr:DUF975 family protein [Candidatus Moranbacteria bacterium]